MSAKAIKDRPITGEPPVATNQTIPPSTSTGSTNIASRRVPAIWASMAFRKSRRVRLTGRGRRRGSSAGGSLEDVRQVLQALQSALLQLDRDQIDSPQMVASSDRAEFPIAVRAGEVLQRAASHALRLRGGD